MTVTHMRVTITVALLLSNKQDHCKNPGKIFTF